MKKIVAALAVALAAALTAPSALAAPPPMETKLIISSFETDKASILPGEDCTLTFVLKNTNGKQYARNITVTVIPSDGALLCDNTDMLYILRLDPGKASSCSFELKAGVAATPGIHTVAVDIKYEDGGGMPHSLQGSLPIEISAPEPSPARLLANAPEALPADAGEPVKVKLDAHNLGKDKIYNLSATAEGSHLKLLKDAYGGNLESGQSATLELTLGFDSSVAEAVKNADGWKNTKPGDAPPVLEYPAKLTLRYEDASGMEYTQTLEFTAKANIPKPDEPSYAVTGKQAAAVGPAPDITGWVVAGLALVLAACVCALALWRTRKRRDAR